MTTALGQSDEIPLKQNWETYGPGGDGSQQLNMQSKMQQSLLKAKEQNEKLAQEMHDENSIEGRLAKTPPDFSECDKHSKANSVYSIKKLGQQQGYDMNDPSNQCYCCFQPVPNEQSKLRFCENIEELASLGTGFALFFAYKKFLIGAFFAISVIYGVPATTYLGELQGIGNKTAVEQLQQYTSKISIGNVFNDVFKTNDTIQNACATIITLNIIAIIFLLIYSVIVRRALKNKGEKLDQDFISAADYALFVKNIDKTMRKENFKEALEKKYQIRVEYVNYCYKIDDLVKLTKQLSTAYAQKGYYKSQRNKFLAASGKTLQDLISDPSIYPGPTVKVGLFRSKRLDYQELTTQIKNLQAQLEELEKKIEDPATADTLFVGKAFVVFQTQVDTNHVLQKSKGSIITNICKECCCCCCCGDSTGQWVFTKAPEPTDIKWENLNITRTRKIINTMFTYLGSFVLVGACFGIIYALTVGKNQYVEKHKNNSKDKMATNVLSAVISIVITLINVFLLTVVRWLSKFEHDETDTEYNLSVALKLTVVRFVNTALVPLAVNRRVGDWFNQGGLITNVFYIFLSICFVNPIMFAIDPSNIMLKLKQCYHRSKGTNSKLNQSQANAIFERPALDMANVLANQTNLIMCCLFYAPLIPIGIPFCFAGLFLAYIVEKCVLLYRVKRPDQMGAFMVTFIANLLPYIALLWALSFCLFFRSLSTHQDYTHLSNSTTVSTTTSSYAYPSSSSSYAYSSSSSSYNYGYNYASSSSSYKYVSSSTSAKSSSSSKKTSSSSSFNYYYGYYSPSSSQPSINPYDNDQYIDKTYHSAKYWTPALGCLIFVIVFVALPIRTCIINRCIKRQPYDTKSYAQSCEDFITDYDIENPMTQKDGKIRLIEIKIKVHGNEMSQQELAQLQQQKVNLQNATTFDAVSNYGQRQLAVQQTMFQPQIQQIRRPVIVMQRIPFNQDMAMIQMKQRQQALMANGGMVMLPNPAQQMMIQQQQQLALQRQIQFQQMRQQQVAMMQQQQQSMQNVQTQAVQPMPQPQPQQYPQNQPQAEQQQQQQPQVQMNAQQPMMMQQQQMMNYAQAQHQQMMAQQMQQQQYMQAQQQQMMNAQRMAQMQMAQQQNMGQQRWP